MNSTSYISEYKVSMYIHAIKVDEERGHEFEGGATWEGLEEGVGRGGYF